ncbi:hypothetical protein JTB14_034756 [Gonioctena quinquepunctata]|nr:hypothetical protein JTB14_034756 [Gonioctena quinquepunctata]
MKRRLLTIVRDKLENSKWSKKQRRKTTSNLRSADNTTDEENNSHTPSTANEGRKRSVASSNKLEDAFIDAIQNTG